MRAKSTITTSTITPSRSAATSISRGETEVTLPSKVSTGSGCASAVDAERSVVTATTTKPNHSFDDANVVCRELRRLLSNAWGMVIASPSLQTPGSKADADATCEGRARRFNHLPESVMESRGKPSKSTRLLFPDGARRAEQPGLRRVGEDRRTRWRRPLLGRRRQVSP